MMARRQSDRVQHDLNEHTLFGSAFGEMQRLCRRQSGGRDVGELQLGSGPRPSWRAAGRLVLNSRIAISTFSRHHTLFHLDSRHPALRDMHNHDPQLYLRL